MVCVFVSRPTWVPDEFKEGLEAFLGLLSAHDLTPRTLGVSDYPAKGPMDEVIGLLGECQGMIVLGYPQIEVAAGAVKGVAVQDLRLATEWNHIEASLAYARGLPLLVIHHTGVGRGIFDRGTLNSFVYERDLSKPTWALAADVRGALVKWKSHVQGVQSEPPAVAVGQSGAASCPNCSTSRQRFFLSPIPKDFVAIEGATHECTRCGFKLPVPVT
jgi:hypothetical protein